MDFVPFDPAHVAAMDLDPAVKDYYRRIADNLAFRQVLMEPGLAWTGLYDGVAIGAAGVIRLAAHRGECWMLVDRVPWRAWHGIARRMAGVFARAHRTGMWRLEASVRADFVAGQHFVRRFGFVPCGFETAAAPDGSDMIAYERVRFLSAGAAEAPVPPGAMNGTGGRCDKEGVQ